MTDYSPQQVAKAIISTPTLQEASRSLGISRNTLLKIKKDKRTKAALKKLAQAMYDDAINIAMINASENIAILQQLAKGGFEDSQKAWIQLNSVKTLNDIAKYGADVITLEKRLERIEGLLNDEETV